MSMTQALDTYTDPQGTSVRSSRADTASKNGFVDGLGERFVKFDQATNTAIEQLWFKRDFSESAVFEEALRERIERFEYFRHPAIATVRNLTRGTNGVLVLESKHTPGRRLSEICQAPSASMALDVIRDLTPALVALHEAGDDVVHGLLGPERVVVTREGRMVLVEHLLGSAVAAMRLAANRLRVDFGLALPPSTQPVTLDQTDDLTQLGLVALAVLLGRRIQPDEYPDQIEVLVGESARTEVSPSPETAWLRRWVERAVQVGPNPFKTAREAVNTIRELSELSEGRSNANDRSARPTLQFVPAPQPERPAAASRQTAVEEIAPATPPRGIKTPTPPRGIPAPVPEPVAAPPVVLAAPPLPVAPALPPLVVADPGEPEERPAPAEVAAIAASTLKLAKRFVTPGLAVVAAAEAVIIVSLLAVRPPRNQAPVLLPPAVVQAQPPTESLTDGSKANAHRPPAHPTSPAATPAEPTAPAAPPVAAATTAGNFGGVRVAAPFDVQVSENGKLLGATPGAIALVEGPHTLDLTNDALEFKARMTTTVKPGQLTPLTVTVPNGQLSVNAVPWAEVVIDGKDLGQTPLANLSIAIGQHDIVFHHPQLGDLHQTAVVKVNTPTRISVTYPK